MPDSNRRPLPCEGSALPTAPIARVELFVHCGTDQEHTRSGRARPTRRGRRAWRMPPAHGHARAPVAVWRIAEPGLMFIKCPGHRERNADVAQLVAHHLAKVRVASSSLVIRSSAGAPSGASACGLNPPRGGVAERLGTGLQSRLHGFESRRHLSAQLNSLLGAIGAAVARFPDTEEVTGSIPVSRTDRNPRSSGGFLVSAARFGGEWSGRTGTESEGQSRLCGVHSSHDFGTG